MRFLAVEGTGDPNEVDGAYRRALELLYGIAYMLKMSYKTDHAIDGFYQYVVPPLEGLCVQCMHVGPYDDELETVAAMYQFAESQGFVPDFTDLRRHHEIYLSDPRKANPARMKTVVRHTIRMV